MSRVARYPETERNSRNVIRSEEMKFERERVPFAASFGAHDAREYMLVLRWILRINQVVRKRDRRGARQIPVSERPSRCDRPSRSGIQAGPFPRVVPTAPKGSPNVLLILTDYTVSRAQYFGGPHPDSPHWLAWAQRVCPTTNFHRRTIRSRTEPPRSSLAVTTTSGRLRQHF